MIGKIKENVIYILIGIIVLLAILCTYLIISKYIFSNNKDSKITCSGEYTRDFNVDNEEGKLIVTDKIVIRYDKTGKIITTQNILATQVTNKSYYNSLKQKKNTDEIKYSFDDKNTTVTETYKPESLKDEKNNAVDIWYLTYVDGLESAGYICK